MGNDRLYRLQRMTLFVVLGSDGLVMSHLLLSRATRFWAPLAQSPASDLALISTAHSCITALHDVGDSLQSNSGAAARVQVPSRGQCYGQTQPGEYVLQPKRSSRSLLMRERGNETGAVLNRTSLHLFVRRTFLREATATRLDDWCILLRLQSCSQPQLSVRSTFYNQDCAAIRFCLDTSLVSSSDSHSNAVTMCSVAPRFVYRASSLPHSTSNRLSNAT